jgi:hypothetical protein
MKGSLFFTHGDWMACPNGSRNAGKPLGKKSLLFDFKGIGAGRTKTTLAMKVTLVKKARPFDPRWLDSLHERLRMLRQLDEGAESLLETPFFICRETVRGMLVSAFTSLT